MRARKEAAVLAGPPPRTPPGTIGRQGHSLQTPGRLRRCTVRLESSAANRQFQGKLRRIGPNGVLIGS